jgi:PAS domain S-box-containing protein
VSTTSPFIRIAILPVGAARRAELAAFLEAAGLPTAAAGRSSEAMLAIVDVTADGGFDALTEAVQGGVPTIALVDANHPSATTRAGQIGASDFVDAASWRSELVLRVRQAISRQAAVKKAEARTADLKRYESYFAHVSDGVAILDSGGRVLTLNPAGALLLGLSPEPVRGQEFETLLNAGGAQVIKDLLADTARGSPRRDLDCAVQSADGSTATLSISAAPLKEGGAAAILSFRDVTAARRLETELKQTKDFLERLINSSADAIIAADMRGRVILFNKGAEDICGYRAEEALGKLNVKELYPPGVAQQVMAQLRDPQIRVRGRLGAYRQEIVAKNGERVPVSMTASIIYEGERESATVGIFTDLRDRVQLERKLSDVENRLEESEKTSVIVELAGTAAHELNQPLTSVMGYADLLKRKLKEDDFAYRPVEIIYREAERMAEIVRKIGKITRYETKSYIGTAKILDLDKASSHEE